MDAPAIILAASISGIVQLFAQAVCRLWELQRTPIAATGKAIVRYPFRPSVLSFDRPEVLAAQSVDDGTQAPAAHLSYFIHVVDGAPLNQRFAGPVDLRFVAVPILSHRRYFPLEFELARPSLSGVKNKTSGGFPLSGMGVL